MSEEENRSARIEGGRRPAEHVWVLAGSMGAVTAVTRFFRALPADPPLAFVVAIRASNDALTLIGRLLAKTTPFVIHCGGLERTLYPRDVLLVSTDGPLPEGPSGERPRAAHAQPTLDEVLTMVAERYRDKAGAIVLSGIGPDGATGCRAITRFGGRLWTQDSESSQFSSLPKYIRDVCDASFSAPPEVLADRVVKTLTPPPPPGPREGVHPLRDRPPGRPFQV